MSHCILVKKFWKFQRDRGLLPRFMSLDIPKTKPDQLKIKFLECMFLRVFQSVTRTSTTYSTHFLFFSLPLFSKFKKVFCAASLVLFFFSFAFRLFISPCGRNSTQRCGLADSALFFPFRPSVWRVPGAFRSRRRQRNNLNLCSRDMRSGPGESFSRCTLCRPHLALLGTRDPGDRSARLYPTRPAHSLTRKQLVSWGIEGILRTHLFVITYFSECSRQIL